MKKGQHVSYVAKCPCYKKHDPCRVFCSGIDGATTVMMYFDTCEKKRDYMKHRCCSVSGCTECRIFQAHDS